MLRVKLNKVTINVTCFMYMYYLKKEIENLSLWLGYILTITAAMTSYHKKEEILDF